MAGAPGWWIWGEAENRKAGWWNKESCACRKYRVQGVWPGQWKICGAGDDLPDCGNAQVLFYGQRRLFDPAAEFKNWSLSDRGSQCPVWLYTEWELLWSVRGFRYAVPDGRCVRGCDHWCCLWKPSGQGQAAYCEEGRSAEPVWW